MSYDRDLDLRFFTRDFIQTHGGAVEDRGQAMEAVLPEELAEKLSVAEYLDLHFNADEKGTENVYYGSPLLEKMVHVAREQVPVTSCVLQFDYLKTAGFDRLIQELFLFKNSVGQVGNTAVTQVEYILLHCSYLAQSDEQKEGLIPLVYNRDTSVEVSAMVDGLAGAVMECTGQAAPVSLSAEEIKKIGQLAHNSSASLLADELQDFEASMNRRFRRDVKNLNEYYTALQQEMEKNLQRAGLSERLIADRQKKIKLIPAELTAKTEDLFKKYSIRTSLKLSGAMLLKIPVVKVFFHVSVGRKKQSITLIYNPILKSIEPLACQQCGASTYQPFFTENMKVLCPECG